MKIKTFIQWQEYRQHGLGGRDKYNLDCEKDIDKQIEAYCKENNLSITSVNHSIVEDFIRHNADATCWEVYSKLVVTVVFHPKKQNRILNLFRNL